jgi:hypothetical protein
MTITTALIAYLIAYAIACLFFTGFILALINGGNRYQDDDLGASEGAFPVDRFEGE